MPPPPHWGPCQPPLLESLSAWSQGGQPQWAADPTSFFVPGTAIADLKVIPIFCSKGCPGICCACSGGPFQRLHPPLSLSSMATNNSDLLCKLLFGQMIRSVCPSCSNMTSAKLYCGLCHLDSGWRSHWLSITQATVSFVLSPYTHNAPRYADCVTQRIHVILSSSSRSKPASVP